MSLYSGYNIFNADLIASGLSLTEYLNILNNLIGNKIGQIKFTVNNIKPAILPGTQVNWSTIASVMGNDKESFDGWVYANGAFVSKSDFPEIARVLESINYPGKNNQVTQITLPEISNFIRMKPYKAGVDTVNTMNIQEALYTTPRHAHSLGSSAGSSSGKIIIKRGAWIWETEGYGKNGVRDDSTYNGYYIPRSPVMHQGDTTKKYEASKDINWDIPVEASINNKDMEFKSTTSFAEEDVQYQPYHISMPAMIYIGRSFQ